MKARALAEAVIIGLVVAAAGTIPRNIFFAANLQFLPGVPWAVPVTAAYIVVFWRYLQRRGGLRANRISARAWTWSLLAGGFGIVALVLALHLVNRMVVLPHQELPDLSQIPRVTIWALLLMAAPVAGIVEEAAFRGHMQTPIEKSHGLVVAIIVTGTMFAVAHLDFTPILWPYYVAVAALYGVITQRTNSILPAVVLHTSGNLYSNFDLLWNGRAEWQAASGPAELIWATGTDSSFWMTAGGFVVTVAVMFFATSRLAKTEAPHTDRV